MSLYPGAPRLQGGKFVLDDAAVAESMAKEMEDAMADLFSKVKGIAPMPEEGKEDRRLLFVAIARGMLKYLNDHQVSVRAVAKDPDSHLDATVDRFDLDVTMEGHTAHP